MINSLSDIVVTLIYVLANLILGTVLLKFFFSHEEKTLKPYLKIGVGFLLGEGILAALWEMLGLGGVFHNRLIWAILIFILIFGFFFYFRRFKSGLMVLNRLFQRLIKLGFIWQLILGLTLILIVTWGIWAVLNPPAGDGEAFYMVLPKIMAGIGKLVAQPNYYAFSQIGFFGEMHFAALMTIAGAPAALFFTWFTGLGAALLLFGLGDSLRLKAIGKIITLVLLFTSSTFAVYLTGGKVDIFGAAMGLGAYFWALKTVQNNKFRYDALILTGLFLGFAFVAKFSNLLVILPGLGLIIFVNLYFLDRRVKKLGKNLLISTGIIAACFFLAIIPHLTKNQILFNEPLAPFIFLHGSGWTWVEQSWYSPGIISYIVATYPLALTFGQFPMQGGDLSVLVWGLWPLGLVSKSLKNPQTKYYFLLIGGTFILGLVFWLVFRPGVLAPRYYLATLLLVIPLIAKIGEDFFEQTNHQLLKIAVIFGLVFVLAVGIFANYEQIKQYLVMGKVDYLRYGRFSYNSSVFLNEYSNPNDRLALFGYYSYWLRVDLLANLITDKEITEMLALKSPDIENYLKSHHFRYLIIQTISYPDAVSLWGLSLKPIYQDSNVVIFPVSS